LLIPSFFNICFWFFKCKYFCKCMFKFDAFHILKKTVFFDIFEEKNIFDRPTQKERAQSPDPTCRSANVKRGVEPELANRRCFRNHTSYS
jgi:hypothetical protein